ncbi:MAG: glycosyltransferase family 2 protein [Planctomycetaceae bacterium]
MPAVSVVVPAYNEARSITGVVAEIRRHLEAAGIEHEVIVVVDGATDDTAKFARKTADQVVEHPQNFGYGRSLKSGITAARYDLIAITDADQTYPVDRIPEMISLAERFDMVVGARQGRFYQGSTFKRWGRNVFRWLSEFSAGQNIPDINSGLRVFRRSQIVRFFPIISAGFSFTTTSTLAYLHNDLSVHYIAIKYGQREGRSKVRHVRDSLRALQIIVEAILRCNPVKMFLLLATPSLCWPCGADLPPFCGKVPSGFCVPLSPLPPLPWFWDWGSWRLPSCLSDQSLTTCRDRGRGSDTNNSTKAGDRPPDSPRGDGTVIRDGDTPDAV